ncbi:PRC-barrel domain-containing protein [Phormidesmis priestleyi]
MLSKAKTLEGYKLANPDDEIGTIKEFYFDDYYWTIRYLVADTGNWLTGRQVLISPYALSAVVKEQHHININLTKQQIESSPSLSSDKPVSQQFELVNDRVKLLAYRLLIPRLSSRKSSTQMA